MTRFEALLAQHFGERIVDVKCRPSPYTSSFLVNEIDVHLEDGTLVTLLAKAAHWDARSSEAARAKPAFLWDDDRERSTYESILATVDLGSARYFGSYVDEAGIRYLLLERIPGARLWECGEFESWCEAARWLARMHARVPIEIARASRAAAHLLRYDRQFYQSWMARAERFHASREAVRHLARRHPRVVDRLMNERPSFLHGEFYSENVLIECRAGGIAVRPVDWEMAAFGPAFVDLAHLVAGEWSDEQRAAVADAYVRELATHGREIPAREHYLKTLDCCLIHLSVQNLGWSDTWSPPPEHAYDWLGEALRLCEKWQI